MYCVIVSGLSGAGKSVAIRAFEDSGFYCVDNLPAALIPTFTDLVIQSKIERVALGIDMRERVFFSGLFAALDDLYRDGHTLEVLFLEAHDEVLIRRYSETRRRHPVATDGSVLDSIALERDMLLRLRQHATRIIDTSAFTVHELRAFIQTAYCTQDSNQRMHILVLSFGFKYGVPTNTDLVFDVRFLPNPHFDPLLGQYTGCDPRVAQYALDNPVGKTFLTHLLDFLTMLVPLYEQEGKAYLTISIGCTGGKHRSVATAAQVEDHLRQRGYRVECKHRDMAKSS